MHAYTYNMHTYIHAYTHLHMAGVAAQLADDLAEQLEVLEVPARACVHMYNVEVLFVLESRP